MSTDDRMIADYLDRLETAAAALPPERRAELMAEISTHIAEARAAEPGASPDEVRALLDRIGSPEDIVRAAAEQGGTGDESFAAGGGGTGPAYGQSGYGQPGYGGGAAAPPPGWQAPVYGGPGYPAARQGLGWMEVGAIVLLLVGGFLAGIGWIVGVILLWLSPRWRLSDKLLGTFVWPGGLAAVIVLLGGAAIVPISAGSSCSGTGGSSTCSSGGLQPGWLGAVLAVLVVAVGLAGPILVTIRLARQARRSAGND